MKLSATQIGRLTGNGEIFLLPSGSLHDRTHTLGRTVKPVACFTHAAAAPRRAVHEGGPRPFRRVAPAPVNHVARSHHVRITPGALETHPRIKCFAASRGEERRREFPTPVTDALGGVTLNAIAFRAADTPVGRLLTEAKGRAIHLAGHLRRDTFRGGDAVQLIVDDAAFAGEAYG